MTEGRTPGISFWRVGQKDANASNDAQEQTDRQTDRQTEACPVGSHEDAGRRREAWMDPHKGSYTNPSWQLGI
jgi:hypothetical protein